MMNENRVKRNQMLGQQIVKNLEARNMEGYYAETKEEALAKALELIPEGGEVLPGAVLCLSRRLV